MGMPVIVSSDISRCDAITDIIQSVALEQAALAHILNAEGEKIQKVVAMEDATADEMLDVNKSVRSMVESISRLEMMLQSKLGLFEDCLCEPCSCEGKTLESSAVEDISPTVVTVPATITEVTPNNWDVKFKSGNGPKDFEITTIPDLTLTEESLDAGMAFAGKVLSVDATQGTYVAVIKAGEGSCSEPITITVTKG